MLVRIAALSAGLMTLGARSASLPAEDPLFDYIVVGGGTAGTTVASRLSEDPNVRVAVVEAGADQSSDPNVMIPGLANRQIGKPEYDWAFRSPDRYPRPPKAPLDGLKYQADEVAPIAQPE